MKQIILILILLTTSACTKPAPPSFEQKPLAANQNQESQIYHPVVKVVDGDTIHVNINGIVEKIRLIGINTPETVDPRKPVECFGPEASSRAKDLLQSKQVYLEKDQSQQDRDRYGRLLRYVTTKDGLFYNKEIIRQGYANEYTYKYPYKYQQEFMQAESIARQEKLGLWGECK